MQTVLTSGGDAPSPGGEENWNQIAPLLDSAMDKLGQKDHDALVLRFFQNKHFAEVGVALGATEDAAKKRVARAVEKLRQLFARRGVDSTADAITSSIAANSIQMAPAGLAAAVTAAAKGAAISTSTLTLVKGSLNIMAWTKAKTAVVGGVAILVAGVATFVTVETARYAAGGTSRQALEIVEKSRNAYAALSSYSDSGTASSGVGNRTTATNTFNIRLQRPNLYLARFDSDRSDQTIAYTPGTLYLHVY